jgi:hypothetical protein
MAKEHYVTEDRIMVYEGDLVYDYYSMEPVIIGRPCGGGWFDTLSITDANKRSRAGMLNGQRICSIEYAALKDFDGAKDALNKVT